MTLRAFKRGGQAGYTLVEIMISAAVLVIVSQAFIVFMRNVGNKSTGFQERTWATEKAVVMMDELRSVIGAGETGSDISTLDQYADDDSTFHYLLTTKEQVTHTGPSTTRIWIANNQEFLTADNYSSGNIVGRGGYQFVRNIKVMKVANDPKVRKIYVRVYWAADNPGKSAASVPRPRTAYDVPIAEIFNLAHTSGSVDIPTQVMDVYLVAIESSPGWWVRTASLRDLMASTLDNMQIRNPGLELRSHWIRRMSFGRDLEYAPEINKALYSDDASAVYDKVYVYPGKVRYNDASTPELFYSPDWFMSTLNVDGTILRPDSYPLADQFNHCMRLGQEQQYYNLLKTIDTNTNRQPPYVEEISYRMLLEGMNNDSDTNHSQLLNSIIINLHGEMAPVPPLRNVSDPAKDPVEFPSRNYRAAAHPEQLKYDLSTAVEPAFRVYAYQNATWGAETDTLNVVTLFFPNLSTDNLKRVERLEGSSKLPYWWQLNYVYPAVPASWSDGRYFAADNFTRVDGASGLRVQLYNVSTTVRAYKGPAH